MRTREEKKSSDLEDGEIREEKIFDDVSDCSMSEIVTLKEGLESEDDVDINVLREEALKSMANGEEENEEELEEELCRLEALKSLLKNMEASEILPSINEINKKHRPKRKRKPAESKHTRKQSKETKPVDPPASPIQPVPTEQKLENLKNQKNTSVPSRPWYPKAELALVCNLPADKSDVVPRETKIKVEPALVRQTVNAVRTNTRLLNSIKQISPSKFRIIKNNTEKYPLVKPNQYKKVTKHSIRKFDNTLLTNSVKTSTPPQKVVNNGRYKLVNNANCTVKRPPVPKVNSFQSNLASKSLFSINRLKCPRVNVVPKELIIRIDDKDSDQEEDSVLNNTSTPISDVNISPACDIQANSDNPSAREPLNERKSELLVMKNSSSNETAKNCPTNHVDIPRESVMDPVRSSPASGTATPVDSHKNESVVDDDKTTCSVKSDEGFSELVNADSRDMSVLVEAEAYLVEIREKLLTDLNELEKTLTRNGIEQEKLNALSKKLSIVKTLVKKFETKITLQQSRLSANVACLNCLFNGVQTRTLTCSKFEEVCQTVGRNLMGPLYKPPSKHETVIVEKRKRIDFSKCRPATDSK